MVGERPDSAHAPLPGEWIATAQGGEVVAHGFDLQEVAQEACRKTHDISFERVPLPQAPLWRHDGPAHLVTRTMTLAQRHLRPRRKRAPSTP
jgi:hypothetical protein